MLVCLRGWKLNHSLFYYLARNLTWNHFFFFFLGGEGDDGCFSAYFDILLFSRKKKRNIFPCQILTNLWFLMILALKKRRHVLTHLSQPESTLFPTSSGYSACHQSLNSQKLIYTTVEERNKGFCYQTVNRIAGFCLETIYLLALEMQKELMVNLLELFTSFSNIYEWHPLFLTFVHSISQKGWGVVSQKVWGCGCPFWEVPFSMDLLEAVPAFVIWS